MASGGPTLASSRGRVTCESHSRRMLGRPRPASQVLLPTYYLGKSGAFTRPDKLLVPLQTRSKVALPFELHLPRL
jgi:hypothetical protein